MTVKIMRCNPIGEGQNTEFLHGHVSVREDNDGVTISVHTDIPFGGDLIERKLGPEPTYAYIINESGKTIDRYVYKPEPTESGAESQFAFFRQTKVKEAIERILEPAQQAPIYALDPGSGGDPSVLGRRDGSVIELIDLGEFRQSDDRKAVASHVASIVKQDEKMAEAINVDTFGVGADHAVELSRLLSNTPVEVVSLNTGDTQKLVDKEQFVNLRAELAGVMRRLVDADAISLPQDDNFKRQMTSIRGKPHVSGKIQLESKEDFKARFGSPCAELNVVMLLLYEDDSPLKPGDFSRVLALLEQP